MTAERDRIDELARRVAERATISWPDERLAAAEGRERALVDQMRIVDQIVEAHWSVPGAPKHLGDFEILREVGRGAMGVVYEARQISLDRSVALKLLSSEITADAASLKRFEREAKALAALNHPNIVTIHSVENVEGLHFINMEFVEGQPLTTRIARGGLHLDEFLDLAVPLADALTSAHEHQIIHRDLKPANIVVSKEGRAKILDFGLAKLRRRQLPMPASDDLAASLGATRDGALVGTVPYMSPEQAECRPVDHRSDIFSLGATFYEMAVGQRPFRGDSAAAVISSILREVPPPVNEIDAALPEDLGRMIAHCLRKNPEHRYQTAKGLRNELAELKTRFELERAMPRRPVKRARSSLVRVAVGVAVLVGAVAAPYFVDRCSAPPAPPGYIAVLPFLPPGSADEELIALGEGLSDVLTAQLTRLTRDHPIQVAAAAKVRGTSPPDIEQLGEDLGVNLAVLGGLQRFGDDVRVTVNLVDVQEGRQIRAEVISANLGDPFALQDRIVRTVADMLELDITPRGEELLDVRTTEVGNAYLDYLRGRGYLRNYDQHENVDKAIAAFEQTLAADPDYAQGHAGLGMAYWRKFELEDDPQWFERAYEECGKAVALDERLAEGHACLGTVYRGTGRYAEAASEFGWAISQDPTNDEAYYGLGRTYERLGEPDAAEEVYRKALSQRPRYWATHNWLGNFCFRHGRYGEAEQHYTKVIELAPESYRGYLNLGGAYVMQARYPAAIRTLEKSVSLKPTAHAYSNLAAAHFGRREFDRSVQFYREAIELGRLDYGVWGNLGEAYYWMQGGRDEAREPYLHAVELAEQQLDINPDDADVLGELAKYHAMLGQGKEAREYLDRALIAGPDNAELQLNAAVVHSRLDDGQAAIEWLERSRASGISPHWIRDNPVFDTLRDDEKFQELIR